MSGCPLRFASETVEKAECEAAKMDVHTVLKLIDEAMTAMYTSSGASSGMATCRCEEILEGPYLLKQGLRTSRRHRASRTLLDMTPKGSAAMSSPDAPSRMACWMARDSELGLTYRKLTRR